MTECESCRRAEMKPARRLFAAIADVVSVHQVFSSASIGLMFAASFRGALGIPEPTWYERHREAWVETGELIELERMKRHVDEVMS